MDSEFPGLVDLNVCGTHYRTLLSTLTKEEDSKLAAMFTGRLPVYKDKDDRYFIEADGLAFQAILHFLRYDELPFQDDNPRRPNTGFSFGTGRGMSLFGGGRNTGYSPSDIEILYKDALNLGISTLATHLEQFQPNFVNMKMDEYRKSIRGYDNCLGRILDIIPAEALFHKTEFTLSIKQDLQTVEDKCCEHDCKMMPWNSFGQPFYVSIDAVVKVPFNVSPTILSALTIDLQRRGYIVNGRMTICEYDCKKEVKQSRYVVFTGQIKNCCGAELYLLTFKWDTDAVVAHPNLFGMKCAQQPSGQKQYLFGQQQVGDDTWSAFGSKQRESGQFGSNHAGPVQMGFGGSQQGTGVDGGSQQSCFGQNQSTGFASQSGCFGVGSGQQQQPAFGQQPAQPNSFFNQAHIAQPGFSSFGSSVPQPGSSSFGSSVPQPGSSSFGSSVPQTGSSNFGLSVAQPGFSRFGSSVPQVGSSSFGSSVPQTGSSIFGSSASQPGSSNFGSSVAQPGFSSFGSSVPQVGSSSFGSSVPQTGSSIIGSSASQPGFSNFGSSASQSGSSNVGSSVAQPGFSSFGSSAVQQQHLLGQTSSQLGSGLMFVSSATNNQQQQISSGQPQSKPLFGTGQQGPLRNQTAPFGQTPVLQIKKKESMFGSSTGSSGISSFSSSQQQQKKKQQQDKEQNQSLFGKVIVFGNQKQKEEVKFGLSSKTDNLFEENRLATQQISKLEISKPETSTATTTTTTVAASSLVKPDFSSFFLFGKPAAAADVAKPDDTSIQDTSDAESTIVTTATGVAK